MTINKGWISLHRQFENHWLWTEKRVFSKAEAWIDILLSVNHSEQKVVIKQVVYTVKRGDSIMSLDSWSNRWGWNKSKVRRFFTTLQSDSMIVTKSETQTTRLTVCNYDSYQVTQNADETKVKRKRNAIETQVTPNNNDNNENNENTYRKFAHLSLSQSDFIKLNLEYTKEQIDSILNSIENYAKNKSYTSLYLTSINWLKKEYPKQVNKDSGRTLVEIMKQR